MNKFNNLFLFFFCLVSALQAQSNLPVWQKGQEPSASFIQRAVIPESYRVLKLNEDAMFQYLSGAPEESALHAAASNYILELPHPDGGMERFHIYGSAVIAPGLARQFPRIRTYLGKGVDNPAALVRLDFTYQGFHAMVLDGDDTYFIDPYFHLGEDDIYLSYYKRDFKQEEGFECLVEDSFRPAAPEQEALNLRGSTGEELRTYRLAVATTGEYAQFHGGTVEGAMSGIVTTMNRVNGVYERDMSVRMILIDSNHQVVYLDAGSDPFSGGSFTKRNQNQTVLDQVIGSANYDVGHVFDRAGGGGVASIETVCRDGQKGLGYTSQSTPAGDPFDIDYVAHELGHQFGGLHTFNYCSGSQGDLPYEPGSATTIMGYAGLCGSNDIANNSNDHFHAGNLEDMIRFTTLSAGNSCPEKIPTGNTPPMVEAGVSGLTIPVSTPFELTASAIDMEGDSLTYSWEQYDLGPGTPVNEPQGNAPLFRSYALSSNPTRVFPRLSSIVSNTPAFGDRLPDYARNLNFRVTVRDNHGFGGGVEWDSRSLVVTDQAGPFRVLSQNQPATWAAGTYQSITWDVANTTQPPVNAGLVDIFLSMDGGFTYPILLEDSLENNGQALIIVPDSLQGDQFRVKVKAVGNVFFDINNRDITIEPAVAPGLTMASIDASRLACSGEVVVYDLFLAPLLGFEGEAMLSVEGLPEGVEASFQSPAPVPSQFTVTLSGLSGLPSGDYPFQAIASGGDAADTVRLNLEFYAGAPQGIVLLGPVENEPGVSVTPELSWAANPDAASYQVEVALDPGFSDIYFSQAGITDTVFQLPVTVPDSTVIYWRVAGANPGCGPGEYTASFFETEIIRCQVYTTEELPVSLASSVPFVISRVTVEDDVILRDVNIRNIEGLHAPVSEMNFRLGSPEGPIIDLITEDCEAAAVDFDFSLDDQALLPLACPFNNGGTYRPEEKLDIYNGQNAKGEWRLIIFKNEQNGSLNNWELELCFPAPLTSVGEARPVVQQLRVFPNPAGAQLTVEWPSGIEEEGYLCIRNVAGQLLQQLRAGVVTGNQPVDISQLPEGFYFIQLFSTGGQLIGSAKFVKGRSY